MSAEPASKFGLLKGLQQSSKAVKTEESTARSGAYENEPALAVNSLPNLSEPVTVPEVRFTNYLDAEVSRRLQVHVAQLKARKPRGGERVSIKSVLHQALLDYLERNGA
jgi:hypothetical protein